MNSQMQPINICLIMASQTKDVKYLESEWSYNLSYLFIIAVIIGALSESVIT